MPQEQKLAHLEAQSATDRGRCRGWGPLPPGGFAPICGRRIIGVSATSATKSSVSTKNTSPIAHTCASRRTIPASFVSGVVMLYEAVRDDDADKAAEAYRIWGFRDLKKETMEVLNVWARFLYEPLVEDKVRTITPLDDPMYGRRIAMQAPVSTLTSRLIHSSPWLPIASGPSL